MAAPTGTHNRHLLRASSACLVTLVALLVAVWIAPRASGAAGAWLASPPVHLRAVQAPGDGRLTVDDLGGRRDAATVTLDAGAGFSLAAVVCDVPAPGPVTVRLRTSLDGRAWGPWYAAPLETVDEAGSAQAFTEPVVTGAARYAQVTAERTADEGPASLSGVRLVAIDPTGGSGLAARISGAARRVAAAVAGIDPTATARAATTAPTIVSRAQWGADERLRSGAPSYAPIKVAFVHHTAGGNTYTQADAPGIVRAIYAYHTKTLHWNDIGYNFLIDRYGTVYEGRYGGVDRGVVGAQVGGFNTGSTGVSVLGTFTDAAPPAATVTALERLLAWKLSLHGLDPQGRGTLTCGLTDKYTLGAQVTFPVIAGHRQANYTVCPGDAFYTLLPDVRADVARRTGTSLVARVTANVPLISPNGDGVRDSAKLSVALSAAADWRLVVRDPGGEAVKSWTGHGGSATLTWDATSGADPVPDGVYTAALTATNGTDAAEASAQVAVDATAPRLTSASAAPPSFSPNGDGQAERAVVSYQPAEKCSVRVAITDTGGTVLRWLHGWKARNESTTYRIAWDGRVGAAGGDLTAARDGLYRFAIERRDAHGNTARRGIPVTVDRTIASPKAAPGTFSPNGDGTRDVTSIRFRLARKATVVVSIRVGDTVVRTLKLGELVAGARSVTWNGRDGSGAYLASSRPGFTVTATSALGESSATGTAVVDLYRPRVFAQGDKIVSPGTRVRLSYKVADPFSATVDVRYEITDAKGRKAASGSLGRRATGTAHSFTWRPSARGVYTVTYRAVDIAGNHEASPDSTTVTVR